MPIPTDQRSTRFIDPPRHLSESERTLLLFLLSKPFPDRDALLGQIEHVRVWGECTCECGTIDLLVPGQPEGLEPDGRTIIAEARNLERADLPVEILVHTVHGVLRELEVVWYGDSPTDATERQRIHPSRLTLGD